MHNKVICQSLGRRGHLEHGGDRRYAQIAELVEGSDLELRDLSLPDFETPGLRKYGKAIRFAWDLGFWRYISRTRLWSWGRLIERYQAAFNEYEASRVFLWENTSQFMGAYVARQRGMRIVAVPQNLESLGPTHVNHLTGVRLPESLNLEIKYLSFAHAVFCISREEQWLLSNFGVPSDYLPYYPPASEVKRMLNLREQRRYSNKTHFLVIGSAFHPPTRLGFEALLKVLPDISIANSCRFEIAGRGTEVLRDLCKHPNVTLRGSVDDAVLDELFVGAKAAIMYQRSGVGALTRIPELLIAGIPVMGNSVACRSAWENPGVTCFESWTELSELLCISKNAPHLPPKPTQSIARLLDALKESLDNRVATIIR